jgi:hypothetical protein
VIAKREREYLLEKFPLFTSLPLLGEVAQEQFSLVLVSDLHSPIHRHHIREGWDNTSYKPPMVHILDLERTHGLFWMGKCWCVDIVSKCGRRWDGRYLGGENRCVFMGQPWGGTCGLLLSYGRREKHVGARVWGQNCHISILNKRIYLNKVFLLDY